MAWQDRPWVDVVSVSLKVGIGLALLYLLFVYGQRWMRDPVQREEAEKVELHPDLYVYPAKSYISSFETAQSKLVGQPLWVKEGYRWQYEPGDKVFEPLEKVVPTRVFREGGSVYIEFERDGQPARFGIGRSDRFYVDEIFFIEDPRELYDHWTDEQWAKVERGEVEQGMSEFQVAFARGAGDVTAASPNASHKVVEYRGGADKGLKPVRVTFRNGVAQSVEPIEGEPSPAN